MMHTALAEPTPHPTAAPNDPPTADRLIVIAGRGRSGSNFLLHLLNHSAATFCRNEPNMLDGTALSSLPDRGRVVRDYPVAFASQWDAAMAATARSLTGFDDFPPVAKDWMRGSGLRTKLYELSRYTGARERLKWVYPPIGATEWRIPSALIDAGRLDRAPIVLKLNQAPGWTVWMLRHRPQTRIIHNVRHPGGFLNSWHNRWLDANDADDVLALNRQRLHDVADVDPAWAARFGDIDAMDVQWSEMWYWRYSNETIYEAGNGRDHYRLTIYERTTEDPMPVMRDLYAFCGLEWTGAVESGVKANTRKSQQIAGKWRDALKPDQVAMIETVLDGSPMAAWWE